MSAITTSRAITIYAFALGLAAGFAFGRAAGLTFWVGVILGQFWGMQRIRERFPAWIRRVTHANPGTSNHGTTYRTFEQQRFLEEHFRATSHAREMLDPLLRDEDQS